MMNIPVKNSLESQFSARLMSWHLEKNTRKMPWKGERNPYRIWLSEIILQQTRVEQGLEYYQRFIQHYPDIHQLANAKDENIFKLWEGLGYYSRCRNLIATARYISTELNGVFPDSYEQILTLNGIGPYTAAAISSFAYNLPHAVVDGNVFRVLARTFGIDKATDTTEGKKYFTALAQRLLDKSSPALYNQAIMDFGAVICKPALPLCESCIFNDHCIAYLENRVAELPIKAKKIAVRKRWFNFFVVEHAGKLAIQQRMKKDIWQQLFEFPILETDSEETIKILLARAEETGLLIKGKYELISVSPFYKQQLSHQTISGRFFRIKLLPDAKLPPNVQWVSRKEINSFAFPGIINQFLSAQ